MTPCEWVEFSGWLVLFGWIAVSVVGSLFLGRFIGKYGP